MVSLPTMGTPRDCSGILLSIRHPSLAGNQVLTFLFPQPRRQATCETAKHPSFRDTHIIGSARMRVRLRLSGVSEARPGCCPHATQCGTLARAVSPNQFWSSAFIWTLLPRSVATGSDSPYTSEHKCHRERESTGSEHSTSAGFFCPSVCNT